MKKIILLGLFTTSVFAADVSVSTSLDFAQVQFVKATQSSDGSWCFNTTVRHNDEGWDHYADAWQVEDIEGNVLAERVLAHPHDNEQPFTRSLCNISLPKQLSKVVVSAKCNLHGSDGQVVVIDLNNKKGINYSVRSKK